jgi:CRP/FNR family transcriptional regulator, cyclic AMP receptor protein
MTTARARRPDLSQLELTGDLDAECVQRLMGDLPEVALEPGDELDITASGAACCLVRLGRLALQFEAGEAGQPRTIGMVEEGDVLVPPTAVWAAVGPTVGCRAIEPSVVALVDEERFDAWLAEPRLAANLVRVLSAQVADRELALAIALEPRVDRRLLLKLRQLATRWGKVTPQGVRLDLRLTHQELAGMVGAVRESVTIALGKLVREDELAVQNRTIWIRERGSDPLEPPE